MNLRSWRPFGVALFFIASLFAALLTGCHKDAPDAGGGNDAAASGSPDASGAAGGHKKGGKGGAGGKTAAPATPVQVQKVSNGRIASTVSVTGDIDALHDIQVAARAAARVLTVNFREGDVVRAGQIVVQQDTTDLQATVRQDEAVILADQAKLDEAREQLAIQVTQAKQNVLNARASLNAAQQNYHKLKNGNRPQDILQAQAATLQAKTTADQALVTYNRDKQLLTQGAIAQSQYDADKAAYDGDQALYVKADAYQKEEEIGYQQEDINSAEEQVREQEANLENQIANERQVAVDKGAVEAAVAVLKQDHNKLVYDQTQVGYAVIRSPVDGVIAARETEPGELATAGTALMRIVNIDTLYYLPTISETDFSATKINDPVRVTVDAIPGQTFRGHVAALYPAADPTTRVFSIRVLVDNPQHLMRPAMFARGSLVTKVARDVPIIPTSALVTAATQVGFEANTSSDAPVSEGMQLPAQQVVVLNPDGKSVSIKPVTLGIVTMQEAQVLTGISAGDTIVTVGQQGLKQGDAVSIVKPGADSADESDSVSTGSSGHHGHRKGAGAAGATGAGGTTSPQPIGASPSPANGGAANRSPNAWATDSGVSPADEASMIGNSGGGNNGSSAAADAGTPGAGGRHHHKGAAGSGGPSTDAGAATPAAGAGPDAGAAAPSAHHHHHGGQGGAPATPASGQ